MRIRNTEDVPLVVGEAGVTVGPGGEFDWPGYDPDVHGAVTGCEPVDKLVCTRASRLQR